MITVDGFYLTKENDILKLSFLNKEVVDDCCIDVIDKVQQEVLDERFQHSIANITFIS